MKHSPKMFRLMTAAALLAALSSCGNPSSGNKQPVQTEQPEKTTLNVTSEKSLSFNSKSHTTDISFSTNESWTASSDVDWIGINPAQGSKGSGRITMTINENTKEDSRSGNITVKAGTLSAKISVTQSGKVETLKISNAAFEAYLLKNFDTDEDGGISLAEAKAIKEIHFSTIDTEMDCIDELRYMENLEVLEACGGTEELKGGFMVHYGSLKTIDLSSNTRLKKLNLSYNHLEAIDLCANTALEDIDLCHNQLTSIDLSRNTVLRTLEIRVNNLKTLDLSANAAIQTVNCYGNPDLEYVIIPNAAVEVGASEGVEVKENVKVESVALDQSGIELEEGDSITLTATISPSDALVKTVRWSSSDESVATVSEGKVTAVKPGKATITVTTVDGGKTAGCSVTVIEKIYHVTGVSLDKNSLELTEGASETLTATIDPGNANDKTIRWSSSDESVATVSDGKVTAMKPGKATITVTTVDEGKTATCSVTVRAKSVPVSSVSLDHTEVSMLVGESAALTATVGPENATDKNVRWSSSDESVAVVTATGVVSARAAGTATITVTTVDGGKTATCKFTITEPYISLGKTEYEAGYSGVNLTLTITANIDYSIKSDVTWIKVSGNTLEVAENTFGVKRTGTVTVSNDTFKIKMTVTVVQEKSPNGIDGGSAIMLP